MLPVHVALVSEIDAISAPELTRIAAALNKQVTRDFGPIWGVRATVDAFTRLEDVPAGYWPIIIRDDIDDPSALGFHTDQHGQPLALVKFTDSWSLTVSHECLEMLADPFGNHLVAGRSVRRGEGRVQFLVEVCDPCEAAEFSYTVNGVMVSDFYTPRFFDPVRAHGVRYDFTGAIRKPRDVLQGGYLSWYNPVTRHLEQEVFFRGSREFRDLGEADGAMSLREYVDRNTEHPELDRGVDPDSERLRAAIEAGEAVEESANREAEVWRALIEELKAGST